MPIPKIVSVAIPLTFLIFTGINSCKSPTEPCTDCGEKKPPTVLDTTSHDFIWYLDTLGAEGSRVSDVAVISENDMWAVGYFFKTPYGDDDTMAYNAMHWDGVKWELKSIPIKNYFFPDQLFYTGLQTIWLLNSTEIWFCDGGSFTILKNGSYTYKVIQPGEAQGGITRIWGESSNKLYFGGTNGSLTYWNGVKFTKLETGTNLAVNIFGYGDTLLTVFSEFGSNTQAELRILNTKTNQFMPFLSEPLPFTYIYSMWYGRKEQTVYCGTSEGLYKKKFNEMKWTKETFQPNKAVEAMNGESDSDIFISGSDFVKAHYNGSTWKNLSSEPFNITGSGRWSNISRRSDAGAIVGRTSNWSFILRFKHNN